MGITLTKSRVWSLWLVSFLVGLRTYQHPLIYQGSFTANYTTEPFAKLGIWQFSRLVFSDEDCEPSSVIPMEKELCNQKIPVPSASTPVEREISGTSKDNLSLEDVPPFPKPGPRCDRRQRKKVKSRILTDSPIKDHIEQEALLRAAVKTKYCKGAKNYRNKIYQKNYTKINFFFNWIWLKNFSEETDNIRNTQDKRNSRNNCRWFYVHSVFY